ncbi:MAG: hypothetical protein VX646_06805 [Verrucomicrobiota bacterium]|nr:hypothetical protein [Verrucomicrobiota bacterium]MEE2967572.1 hypothetical protein [Verrucomicrobiota bacterium]
MTPNGQRIISTVKLLCLLCVSVPLCFTLRADQKHTVPVWSKEVQRNWVRAHSDPAIWVANVERINDRLLNVFKTTGATKTLSMQHFWKWVGQVYWAKKFLIPYFHEMNSTDDAFQDCRSLLAVEGLGARSVSYVSETDDKIKFVQILSELLESDKRKFERYMNLAVAVALVWDEPFPDSWPHPNVNRSDLPIGGLDPLAVFNFYVSSHEMGKLKIGLDRLSIRELCFVIDTPVQLAELKYAQQIKLKSFKDLERLYKIIPYDQQRINNQSYEWPHGPYRLIDIGAKRGGICMDQSYFAAHAAKSQGIPAILFMGQGRSGGHAWVGYLESRGRWKLNAARWASENYPVGFAYDPQTWERISDAQFEFYLKSNGDSPSRVKGKSVLAWALLNKGSPQFESLLRLASKIMPRSKEPWQIELNFLNERNASLNEMRVFWLRWISNFKEEKGTKAKGQIELLKVLRSLELDSAAMKLGRQIVSENRSGRFDLGITVASDEVFDLQRLKKWTEAHRKYKLTLEQFQSSSGGHLFYNLIEPYVRNCLLDRRMSEASDAMALAGKIIKPVKNTILYNDLEKLRAEID